MSFPRGRGKVFRNPPRSEEAMPVPPLRGQGGIDPVDEAVCLRAGDGVGDEAGLEGGRQIDPSLVARSRIEGLKKEIGVFREREKVLRGELESLNAQREEEIVALNEERKTLRIETEREAERLKDEARREGFALGHEEGLSSGVAEVESRIRKEYQERFGDLLTFLAKVRKSMDTDLDRMVERNGPMLVRLWQAMLKRFLRREIALDGETSLRVFREVAGRISDRTKIRIFLNPEDRDMYTARESEFVEIKRVAEQFDLIADESIERGGCLIETNLGVYDARLRSQLEAVDSEIDGLFQEGCSDDGSAE